MEDDPAAPSPLPPARLRFLCVCCSSPPGPLCHLLGSGPGPLTLALGWLGKGGLAPHCRPPWVLCGASRAPSGPAHISVCGPFLRLPLSVL